MEADVVIAVAIIALVVGAGAVWLLTRQRREGTGEGGTGLTLIQNQINELSRILDLKLTESTRFMQDSLRVSSSESNKIIRDVVQELTRVGEGQKQVMSFTDQLKSLQDILKNPKQRGILGEYYLETLLKNVLPPGSYQMQYPFQDGTIVDAVVFVKEKIIPIDSKFSLENYNRITETTDEQEKGRLEKLFVADLKNRILETSKYIQPEQGTMDFAFMFIPHEAIYYDLLVNKIGALTGETDSLIHRAAGKYRVIIVSPTSFLAYLQTVLQGLKALQIEESVKGVIKNVGELQKHLVVYEEYHTKVGSALGTVVNHFNVSQREFKKVDKDILRITGESVGVETLALEKPELVE